ncbi:STAS domain-containing protein [Streptomyces sp. NPDC002566]|uniref:STAS domain-containing protein n=1 Tax=Streptomyces sp. NPDC002566 TaxID=3364650 RepID=UPI0036A941E7
MDDEAEITVDMIENVLIVRVSGEFDADEADTAARSLAVPSERPAASERAAVATVVDLSGVTFADSSLLHSLLTAQQHHGRAGLPFVLAAVSPLVRRLLDLTDTARAFTLADSLADAVELVRAHGGGRSGTS